MRQDEANYGQKFWRGWDAPYFAGLVIVSWWIVEVCDVCCFNAIKAQILTWRYTIDISGGESA
jgi:hypothetical protein